MEVIKRPLSNMQLELLKLFSRELNEEDLIAIKRLIVKYLAEKVSSLSDQVWEEQNWTNDDMDKLLNTHLRTSHLSNK